MFVITWNGSTFLYFWRFIIGVAFFLFAFCFLFLSGGSLDQTSLTAAQIASHVDGRLEGDGQRLITGIAPIDQAREGDVSFIAQPKYYAALQTSPATAIIADAGCPASERHVLIRVQNPYHAFLQVASFFAPPQRPPEGIDAAAVIHPSVKLGKHVAVGPHVVIEQDAQIGDEVVIGALSFIGRGVVLGEKCFLAARVHVAHHVVLGKNVAIQSGSVIGADGFGYVPVNGRFIKIPHTGTVILEDEVEIGANCAIDRGTFGETRIGGGTKLDNLIHVAHNVQIGKNTVIAAQTGISGSTKIGHNVQIGGQVGFVGHIEIGDNASIGAQSGVSKSVPGGQTIFGYPAKEIMQAKREEASIRRLPELFKRVKALEKALMRVDTDFRLTSDE
jgi:UDP-3-O-[3-hydroxymyristoyl] glucosamine N-acyltransferase